MQMLAAASPRHGKHLRQFFVCSATPAFDVCVSWPELARRQRTVRLARSKNERAGACRLGCARVRPTFCTQLDWASAGTKLSGQLQARCLVHPLPSPGHGAQDTFSQIISEGQTSGP